MFPLGLAYAALGLFGHEVRGCDLQLEVSPDQALAEGLREFDPDVVAIALRNVDSSASYDRHSYLPSFEKCIHSVKQKVPEAIVIVGGPGFSLFAETIMKRFSAIDIGVVFESESTLSELLQRLDNPCGVSGLCYRENGKIVFSERCALGDFSALPAPDRSLFPLDDYVAAGARIGVQTKQGCPFLCVSCTYPFLDGRSMRTRAPNDVVDEIEDLVESGARDFFFCDSVFNVPRRHAETICREILRRRLKIRWQAFFNESHVTQEQIILARDAGCDLVIYGPDAGHPTTLLLYNKGHTESQLRQAYRWCRQARIPYKYAFLMNGPGETFRSFFHLLGFLSQLWITARLRFSLSTMRIYPHTELHEIALKNGIVSKSDDLLNPRYFNPLPLRIPCAAIGRFERLAADIIRRLQSGRRN
ncbi:MAG: cobalamin-dependent protein [Thermoanaerobaculales bacterium]|nr:cobalamin-dependent protein [Thermoanaerobaculales bacterium]